MIYTINKLVTDDFTHPMFVKILKDLATEAPAYYLWSNPPSAMESFLTKFKSTAPVVFIGIKDLLDCWKDFNFWHDSQQQGSRLICNMAQHNPKTKFVLFTSLENLEQEIQEPNVYIIPWGGDYVNQRAKYLQLEPVLDKNFDSERTFICLNRNIREQRVVNVSYLFGCEYNKRGVISYLGKSLFDPNLEPIEFLDRISWEFDDRHNDARTLILDGYKKVMNHADFVPDDYKIYEKYGAGVNDNFGNFQTRLRPMYQNSFVEIVSESSFTAPSYMLTEKTAHSFFGCNFPIILSGCGAVAHLRDVGFDMFDDVVDHGYDQIKNPFDRILGAIDANHRLLTDGDHAKQTWLACKDRFENNIKIFRNMFDWYENRTRQQLSKILDAPCN
jgi:hypothetical protein